MPQVSSLSFSLCLGSVSTHSRGLSPLPLSLHSALVRAAPKRLLGAVLIHHGSSSCWIKHHPDAWRAAWRNLSHSSFYSCLTLTAVFFFFFSLPLYTPGQTMHPFFAMPWSALVRKLSHTSKTAQQHLKNIQVHIHTHRSVRPAGRQADTVVHGGTGTQTVMSSGRLIRWRISGKNYNMYEFVSSWSCRFF